MTLETLREQALACTACPLSQTRLHVVFGTGNPQADILFVGEGPGRREDETGEPFVGAAGKLLDTFLAAMDMDRSKVYIANIVKCRPPENRDPLPQEEDACMPFLEQQIALLQPKLLICLGRIAAKRLIRPDFQVTKEHGRLFQKDGYYRMATFHPAALLRNPATKAPTFEDFEIIRRFYSNPEYTPSAEEVASLP